MTIKYDPAKVIRRIASLKKIKKLVTQKLTLNKAALALVSASNLVSPKEINKVALKAIKKYKENYKNKDVSRKNAVAGKKLLLQRVKNSMVQQVAEKIKEKHDGEFYIWLETTANVPDEEHRRNWGNVFQIGKGEMPGDRWGCLCGMEILVDSKRLNL